MLGCLAGAAVSASAAPAHAEGEDVLVTGVVTDAQGQPLAGVRVVLEASRQTFSLRALGKVKRDPATVTAQSDERGEYTLTWRWNGYYNHFELAVGVMVRKPAGERFETLDRVDITRRLLAGSPVAAPVTVTDTAFLAAHGAFLAALDSDDERSVYNAMGKPDRVEITNYPQRREEVWWYFESGKAYRFHDGALDEVVPFDPVRPFATPDAAAEAH